MQRAIEELTAARGHTLLARRELWKLRKELLNYTPYNNTQEILDALEGTIIVLEAWKEETCEKS